MKQMFKLIIMIAIFLILTIFLSSRFYYKRSVLATVAEIYLKVTNYEKVTQEKMEAWLRERKCMKEELYMLPNGYYENILIKEYMGMQVLHLNENGKGDVVIYLHGGSYIHEPDPNHFTFLYNLIKKSDIRVILPIYPRAPKYNFKDAYEKVISLYKEISKDKDVVLMGDSAGGGFALGLTEELKKLSIKAPKKIIAISPWVDLTMENPDILLYEKVDPWLQSSKLMAAAKFWSDGQDLKDSRLSPIFGDVSALKNLTIITGTRDILYPDIMLLVDKLRKEKVKFNLIVGENLNHDYPLFPIPEAKKSVDIIADILNEN